MPATSTPTVPYNTGYPGFRDRDVGDSSTSNFTSCAIQCLENASESTGCDATDTIQCICQGLIARQLAFLCIFNHCSQSDHSQLLQDCNDGDDATITLIMNTTTVPPSITAISKTPSPLPPASTFISKTITEVSVSASLPSRAPHSGVTGGGDTSNVPSSITSAPNSVLPPASTTPPPISTPDASSATESSTLASNSTMDGTSASPSISSATPGEVATSDTPDPYQSSAMIPPTQSSPSAHGLSSKASISLSVALGVAALVALLAFLCLRRRQRRRRGTPLARLLVPNLAQSDDASARGDLATVTGHPSPMTPVLALDRLSTIHIFGAVPVSSSTAPSTPQSASDERAGHLLSHGAVDALDTRATPTDMAPLSRRGTSSWFHSLCSTRAAVGGSGEPPVRHSSYTDAGPWRLDGGAEAYGRGGAGAGARATTRTPGDTHAEKTPTRQGDQDPEFESAQDMSLRPPLPSLLASSLVSSGASPLGSAGGDARRSGALRAPRFVTVLMEVEEEELEGQGEPPAYRRHPEQIRRGAGA